MELSAKPYVNAKIKELKERVSQLEKKPYLVIIRVGDDPASERYVNNKVKRCQEVGIDSQVYYFPQHVSESEVADTIYHLNMQDMVTGILLQLPLPSHLDGHRLMNLIKPEKDVDALTIYNEGLLFKGCQFTEPCTPRGIIDLLKFHNIEIQSKRVLIISRSEIVGKPLAHLFLQENATITVAHSYTNNIFDLIKQSDIIVTAVGKPNFITKEQLRELDSLGQVKVIVDVSINFNYNNKMCGDCFKQDNFQHSLDNIYITPVPGGVGQCTVLALLENTIELAEEEEE